MSNISLDKSQEHSRRKGSLPNKWCWEKWNFTWKRMKLDPYFAPSTKINSKWNKNLNIRPEAIKLLEENTGKSLLDISLGYDFMDVTPKTQATKATMNKWDYIKIKSFCSQT